jgi:hypothetical protein
MVIQAKTCGRQNVKCGFDRELEYFVGFIDSSVVKSYVTKCAPLPTSYSPGIMSIPSCDEVPAIRGTSQNFPVLIIL